MEIVSCFQRDTLTKYGSSRYYAKHEKYDLLAALQYELHGPVSSAYFMRYMIASVLFSDL